MTTNFDFNMDKIIAESPTTLQAAVKTALEEYSKDNHYGSQPDKPQVHVDCYLEYYVSRYHFLRVIRCGAQDVHPKILERFLNFYKPIEVVYTSGYQNEMSSLRTRASNGIKSFKDIENKIPFMTMSDYLEYYMSRDLL